MKCIRVGNDGAILVVGHNAIPGVANDGTPAVANDAKPVVGNYAVGSAGIRDVHQLRSGAAIMALPLHYICHHGSKMESAAFVLDFILAVGSHRQKGGDYL